jgi:large subunit ribosomal protein L15
MKLHEMSPTPGSRKSRKRVGRGTGSGWGKTAGRGENGQKSRSGFKNKVGFEGGQNPLYKRIPKRGFNNINHIEYTIVNLETIQKLGLPEITPKILIENRVIKNSYGQLKVLGNGELTIAVKVSAEKFSKSAVAAIEKAGGSIITIEK